MMVESPTILVIDDDPDIRGDLRMILEDQGYRVVCAPDGQAGLRMVQSERPNCVICDMMMPNMSGFMVLERVKTDHRLQTPFIMLTANESVQQRMFAEFLGADVYLHKPIGTKPLLDNLRKLCPPPAHAPQDGPLSSATAV
jgi:DNA-binding response OmpR family regulator